MKRPHRSRYGMARPSPTDFATCTLGIEETAPVGTDPLERLTSDGPPAQCSGQKSLSRAWSPKCNGGVHTGDLP